MATIEVGGVDSGSTISFGGTELVYGSANGDVIAGSQTVSTGTSAGLVTNETVVNGGVVFLSIKTTSASNTTVDSGGALNINGAISANNTVLSGGTVDLESAKATLTGSLVFAGGGTLDVTGNTSAGSGDLAVVSGFAAGAVVDITSATTLGAAVSATLSTTVSGSNTVATVSGGGVSDTFIFAGTTIGSSLKLGTDNAGGLEITLSGASSAVTSVGSGQSIPNLTVSNGSPLTVYAGGTIVTASILAGGSATILSGGTDSGSVISLGGTEIVQGSATGDNVFGSQTVSGGAAVVNGETVESGGSVTVSGGTASGVTVVSSGFLGISGTALNTTIAGGTLELLSPAAALSGTVGFSGAGTLDIAVLGTASTGEQAVISGFYSGDVIALPTFAPGATLSTTVSGGNTVATVSGGGATETLTFSGSVASNLTLENTGRIEQIDYAGPPTTTAYTPGDLVLSVYGDGSGTGSYSLDQAAPITLEEITTTGQIVSVQELPQTTTLVDGTTEYAVSGEYESASEGLLTLAGNGQSLTILGYGVNAASFDAPGASATYGTSALGQTNSEPTGTNTVVDRIVADIGYNGSVDTSTSLSGVFNTNNPRSVYTTDGTTFDISGQGNGADGTEGVFTTADGAPNATAIYDTTTDTREIQVYDGQLYVSIDSKLNGGGGIYDFGPAVPDGPTAPVQLAGIGHSIVLTAGEANSVDAADVGQSVNLSPEQFFFANPTTLYVADGGDPKEGGLGDGGLQKWSLVGGTWNLDYTLSLGLDQVPDTEADGTTGLVGLTGTVEGNNVVLYATNETVAETDQTYLYGITDSLAATTLPTSESFTLLETAAPDTLIRGVAFAPTASATTPQVSTTVTVSTSSGGLEVTGGGDIIVQNGGTISGTSLLSGAVATVSTGGIDQATFIAHNATETVQGSASFDTIDGVQSVTFSAAVVTSETVENGGSLDLYIKGATASATTVNTGGELNISGNADALNTVVNGGAVFLQSPKAVLSGSLSFVGSGGSIEVTSTTSSGYGDLAVISGFGASDVIDERVFASASLVTSVSGADVVASVTSGASVETFTFAGSGQISGSAYASGLALSPDNSGGVELAYTPPPPVDLIVSSTVTSGPLSITDGNEITVLNGGTMTAITVSAGGSAIISAGGVDSASTIEAGGFETVSGSATGDQIYGIQDVTTGPSGGASPATVSNETVFNGGTLELYLKPDTANDITVSSGGDLLMSGNVSGSNITIEAGGYVALQSPKATLSGSLVFSGSATLALTAITSAGFGDFAVISGWQAGDIIDETTIGAGSASLTVTTSGGNTVATISGATFPESFIFSGGVVGAHIEMVPDAGSGVELTYVACFAPGTGIMTDAGERPIEVLQPGDLVRTATGTLRPVRWIGIRTVDLRRHAHPRDVAPVRVRAGAVAPNCPSRDVVLSPDHALFIDGALIPVRYLVNGRSIVQESANRVTWRHVELETHDVILADGMPAESYLDTGNRAAFANAGISVDAHPRFGRDDWAIGACAPLVTSGQALETVYARLLARAGDIAAAA